ncbi:MAG: methylmalonyl-CoA mutase small subunit [Prevotella sp.]|nr:methylmalonyl-CoA mutase small subunit [Candidatus Equicola stercoris]
MSQKKEKLFSDFTAPSKQEWLDKIEVDLKGADFQKRLVWRTNEGFNVQPFYMKEDLEGCPSVNALPGEFPFVRGNKKDNNIWYVRQNIAVEDLKSANAKALDILNKGVDSLCFQLKPEMVTKENIATLMNGIKAECIEVNFCTCPKKCVELAQILVAYYKEQGYDMTKCVGSINFDPIHAIMTRGADKSDLIKMGAELIATLKELPKYRCISVNSVALVDAGCYIYQELGYALAWGNEYLQQMVDAGVEPTEAACRIKFNMGVSVNYFMEIAKFRAARMLWAQIVKQYEPKCDCACKMNVCANTTSFNQTVFDSYVNLLRSQTESMSAALANVDSIVVTPFDKPYEVPTEFAERIARNQQLLLKEEAHFDKIVDVAGGSYYVENLTKSIAEQAWKLFLETEATGGFLKATLDSKVQEDICETNAARHAAAAKRKEFMLGTNQFPNFTEVSEGKKPITCKCCCHTDGEKCETGIKVLDFSRMASDFEALRLKTESAAKQPVAFMLTIGNLAMRQARAQFSCNFLAAAGYKVVDNLGFKTIEEGVEAAMKANADIVVLCSSDDEYAEYAVPAFKALDNRAIFIVAGAPACMEDLQKEGIENFIHVRSNQLDTLKSLNEKMGI